MKLRTKPPPSSSASIAELTEMLQQWIESLGEKSAEGGIILVEGVKDAEALRRVGVNGEILCVKSRRSTLADVLHPLVDVNREVIVLPDFDRRGKQLAGRIVRYLQGRGGNPNLRFWLRVHGVGASHVKDVEGLIAYLENVKRNTMT